jgi:regulation of enolase protein 1 (concanavalin A-like superfamily)
MASAASGGRFLPIGKLPDTSKPMKWPFFVLFTLAVIENTNAGETLFQDDFAGKLGDGWTWRREHREAWRVTDDALEVRIEPGNMWGPANDAKNVLLRPAPDVSTGEIEISVTVETHPTAQYEQADLTWYYDDGHMVKIGRELVDGQVSVVMGREEADKTRTIKIVPIKSDSVRLKLIVKGKQVRGEFQTPDSGKWQRVGGCDVPFVANIKPSISLQFYQGPADADHWARVSRFRIQPAGSRAPDTEAK